MPIFDTGVRPVIDAYLKTQAEKVRDYGDYWSASSAGYCMRRLIFERLGVPPTTEREARVTRVFEAGHIFHEWVQRITMNAGISIAQEVELQDEDLMVRGHIDDLLLIAKDPAFIPSDTNLSPGVEAKTHNLILYDYKTQSSRAFHYQKDRTISYFHKMQLATYMYMLRQKNWLAVRATKFDPEPKHAVADTKQLTEGRIMKISKDDLSMTEDVLLWSPELESEVFNYWNELNAYWKNRKLPKCTCGDYEGGFMAKLDYNPFFYNNAPCSIDWYNQWKDKHDAAR